MKYEIRTDIAIDLASLSEEALKDFDKFVYDLNYLSESDNFRKLVLKQNYMDADRLISFCQRYYEPNLKKKQTLFSVKDFIYLWLAKAHKVFLSEYIGTGKDFKRLYTEVIAKNTENYSELSKYLLQNQDKKELILQNLRQIDSLKINKFQFDYSQDLPTLEKKIIIIAENPFPFSDNQKRYYVDAVINDGKMLSLEEVTDDTYACVFDDYHFEIHFVKGSVRDKVNMIVHSLDFATDALPSYDLLTDSTIPYNLNVELAHSQKIAVEINYRYEQAIRSGKEFQTSIKNLSEVLQNTGISKEPCLTLSEKSTLEALITKLGERRLQQIADFSATQGVSIMEVIHKTEEKLDKAENAKIRYYRKRHN